MKIQGVVSALLVAFVPLVLGRPAQDTARSRPLHNVTANHCADHPALYSRSDDSMHGSLSGWWCDQRHEYAFVGFSYAVSECQSQEQMTSDFRDMRSRFQGRYVRLYGACDRNGFFNDVVEAAWTAGIGVHALIWFGFTGGNEWMRRRDDLFNALHANPKAKFVTRAVQFGSEPLFDKAIDPYWLADEVKRARNNLASLNIPVTISDLAYSYQQEWNKGGKQVLENVDVVDAHMLPYFSQQASTARNSWHLVMNDINWFISHSNGKKIYLSENGWPSVTTSSIQPNSPNAVANVQNEHDYFTLLDEHCNDFKWMAGGGIGWFAHIYSDKQAAGYGIYNEDGMLKFPFRPRTEC